MNTEVKQDNTIKFRIDESTLGLLDRASEYMSLNKSKFIRQCIREKSEAVIAQHDKTQFSEKDWMMFFDMLDHPSATTDRMKKAQKKYNEIISKQ